MEVQAQPVNNRVGGAFYEQPVPQQNSCLTRFVNTVSGLWNFFMSPRQGARQEIRAHQNNGVARPQEVVAIPRNGAIQNGIIAQAAKTGLHKAADLATGAAEKLAISATTSLVQSGATSIKGIIAPIVPESLRSLVNDSIDASAKASQEKSKASIQDASKKLNDTSKEVSNDVVDSSEARVNGFFSSI